MNYNNIAEAFYSRINQDGNFVFMNRKGEYTTYTYSFLWRKSLMYAQYFKEQGVKKGDTISIILPSCPEFIMTFMATQILGAVPVSLYPMMSLGEVSAWKDRTFTMMNQVNCKHFLGNSMLKGLIDTELADNNILGHTIEDINTKKELYDFDTSLFPTKDDLCFLQFSSGTTSAPKPVMISQENAIINATLVADQIGIPKDQINTVTWLPLYHDMGLVGTFLASILGGKNLIIIRPDDFIRKPYLWFKAITDYKAQVTTAPNFAYGLACKRVTPKQMEQLSLESLHLSGCGGEAVYKETIDKFIEKFKHVGLDPDCITPMYGMAEATVAVSFSSHNEPVKWRSFDEEQLSLGKVSSCPNGKFLCSLGKPLDTFKVEVRDENGDILEENKVGRLYLMGPSVFKGYFNDDEKTKASFKYSMLDTGDQGFISNGEIYVTGRAKDTMIIRGRNYYPTIFEESLTAIAPLREGRVIVSSHWFKESDSEEMIVLAEVKDERDLKNVDDLTKIVAKRLSETGELNPKIISFYKAGTLPRTSSGKLRRSHAVKLWKEEKLTQEVKVDFFERANTLKVLFRESVYTTVNNFMRNS
jgi:fatty-acyl-CoA synthase